MRVLIFTIISIFLDLLFNLYAPISINSFSLFMPLFSIVLVIYLYKFFENDLISYFIISSFIGLIYGISFTSTGILYLVIYFLIAFTTGIAASYFKPHFIVNLIILMITIIIYLLITYFILIMFNIIDFNIFNLLFGIVSSLLLNIIYLAVISYLDYKTTKKKTYYL